MPDPTLVLHGYLAFNLPSIMAAWLRRHRARLHWMRYNEQRHIMHLPWIIQLSRALHHLKEQIAQQRAANLPYLTGLVSDFSHVTK